MKRRLFAVPLAGLACLAVGVVPAAAHPEVSAPTRVAAPAAVQTVAGTLPVDGDPTWSRVFTELFQDPALPNWRNLGSRPLSECLTVGSGKATLYARPNGDGQAWQCRITSNASFATGTYIFAARVKVHSSEGHLSSFWLNSAGGAQTNEIDVIENAGVKNPKGECKGSATVGVNRTNFTGLNQAYYSGYTPRTGYKYCFSEAESTPLQNNAFHTFHVEYTPGQDIKYFSDGVPTATLAAPYDTPLNLILSNISPDGAPVPAPGAKDFEVEWVKVWKKNPPPPPAPCADNDHWRAQFGTAPYDYQPNSDQSQANQKRYIFDRIFYYYTYADVRAWAQNKVATQGGNLWDHVQWHWLHYGVPQGRTGAATFDPIFYMNTYPDISAAFGWNNYQAAMEHYVSNGRNEGRRGSLTFDPAFYRGCYGDLAGMSNAELLEHFTRNGMDEGRQGSGEFAPAWYLAAYPDVRAAFGANNYRGGMIHWISGGRGEGRAGHP